MDSSQIRQISKSLSYYLRHRPDELGLTLAEGGYVAVLDLLSALSTKGISLTRSQLNEVVETNDKRRFSFDESGDKIRANQGHSVEVDLQLQAITPPPVLYHGTTDRFSKVIEKEGLRKMARHHVHLSADKATAITVGKRHGRPVIFEVLAGAMAQDGFAFYRSENGVWLAEEVPPKYLRLVVEKKA